MYDGKNTEKITENDISIYSKTLFKRPPKNKLKTDLNDKW